MFSIMILCVCCLLGMFIFRNSLLKFFILYELFFFAISTFILLSSSNLINSSILVLFLLWNSTFEIILCLSILLCDWFLLVLILTLCNCNLFSLFIFSKCNYSGNNNILNYLFNSRSFLVYSILNFVFVFIYFFIGITSHLFLLLFFLFSAFFLAYIQAAFYNFNLNSVILISLWNIGLAYIIGIIFSYFFPFLQLLSPLTLGLIICFYWFLIGSCLIIIIYYFFMS